MGRKTVYYDSPFIGSAPKHVLESRILARWLELQAEKHASAERAAWKAYLEVPNPVHYYPGTRIRVPWYHIPEPKIRSVDPIYYDDGIRYAAA